MLKNEKLIQLKKVGLSTSKLDALSEISFYTYAGENIVFFGTENTGLEKLFPLILGFEEDFYGDVFFKRKNIREFNYVETFNYRTAVGYVHRDFGLVSNMTVEMNIKLPLEYHSKYSDVEINLLTNDILSTYHLLKCKDLRPVDLTHSEMLRTAFGRATALDPDILFMEHAFEGQSPLNVKSIMINIEKRASRKDKSMIFITYSPQKFLDIADTFIMLYEGKIVFRGKKEDYINSDNPYLVQFKNESLEGPMDIL